MPVRQPPGRHRRFGGPRSAVMLDGRRTDRPEVDHAREIRRFEAARDRSLAALQNLALDVHLPQAALGVALRPGDDRNVVDSLTRPGAYGETVADHGATLLFVEHPGA